MSILYFNKIQHFLLISILLHFSFIISWAYFTPSNKNHYEFEVFLLNDIKAIAKESPKKNKISSSKSAKILQQSQIKETIKESTQSTIAETIKESSSSDFSLSEITHLGSVHSGGKEGTLQAGETKGSMIVDAEFGSVNGPSFIHREIPAYPQIARKLGKEGRVVLRLTINERGEVVNIEVIEAAPYGFTESAVDAVKKSRFSPAMKDGKPVTCRAILPVRFILKN